MGNNAAAKPYYMRAATILEEASPNNPDLARYWDDIATVDLKQGEVNEACRLYDQSLGLREKVLGSKHHEVGESLKGLAECARAHGHLKQAAALFERSFSLCIRPDGGYYPQAVDTLTGYAALLREMGEPARAAEKEALAAKLRKQGP
jgi:tetratricopeptide (TPR) repeat protein